MNKNKAGSETASFVILTLVLFGFWLVLSGKFEVKYVTIGLITSVVVALITRPLLMVPLGGGRKGSVYNLPWLKLLAYFPWLLWQIVLSNIDVAKIILNPNLPIQPQLVKFRRKLPGPVAHLTLANSITLTPGTITVEIDGDEYLVHALHDGAAQSLAPEEGEGEMPLKVAWVFTKSDVKPERV